MKFTSICAIAFAFASLIYAHEGHDHASGVGNVITTATVTGPEGHRFVTAPGWGSLPREKNIGEANANAIAKIKVNFMRGYAV